MEEDEYKSTYRELTTVRCVFEKALTNNHARCRYAHHFCLADREGYSCEELPASMRCKALLEQLRKKSQFVFKLAEIGDVLPHNMEIRVQAGGVRGLARSAGVSVDESAGNLMVEDISGAVEKLVADYGAIEEFPYSEIIQSIEQFRSRRRRHRDPE